MLTSSYTRSLVPRICVVGEGRGVGKSLIVTGLVAALKARGLSVSCCVRGEALTQALIYSRITRRYARCLSSKLLDSTQITQTLGEASIGADLVVIDGSMGLLDGDALGDLRGSDTEFIRATGTPAVVVLEAPDLSTTLMASLRGLASFTEGVSIHGCILNGLRRELAGKDALSASEWEWLSNGFNLAGLPGCVGCVPVLKLSAELPEAGLIEGGVSASLPLQLLTELRDAAEAYLDIDGILALAAAATPLEYDQSSPVVPFGRCRIAVANDNCFGVCFEDNLDLLRLSGAELISVSPLVDSRLPDNLGGIYLPGAFLGEYCDTLERNQLFSEALRDFAQSGGVVFAEGGGAAFLCESFRPLGASRAYKGVGLLAREATACEESFSAGRAALSEDCVLGSFGSEASALITSGWRSDLLSGHREGYEELRTVRFSRRDGTELFEGFSASANLCASFNFIHFGSNPEFAKAICKAAAGHQVAKS